MLQNFGRVWERVTASSGDGAALPEEKRLKHFIEGETAKAQLYSALAKNSRSGYKAHFFKMRERTYGSLKGLQVELFLMTGDSYSAKTSRAELDGVLSCMRRLYISEEVSSGELKQAGQASSGSLAETYGFCARCAEENMRELKRLIERAMA